MGNGMVAAVIFAPRSSVTMHGWAWWGLTFHSGLASYQLPWANRYTIYGML